MRRTRALLAKELLDLRGHLSLFAPAVLIAGMVTLLPVFVAVVVPSLSGDPLATSNDLEAALGGYRTQDRIRSLDPETAAQAYVFQHFLLLLVLAPITSSVSIAAHGIVSEKQARTLEPLLSTPITTLELLTAKVAAAWLPALAVTVGALVVYGGAVALFARTGVLQAFLDGPSLAFVAGPGLLAALAAVQLAVCVSSVVDDARTAQQVGALVILPLVGLFLAQLFGAITVTPAVVFTATTGLLLLNILLMAVAVRLFRRESILTRWR
jgi:ABC-2 type transport system permease protein